LDGTYLKKKLLDCVFGRHKKHHFALALYDIWKSRGNEWDLRYLKSKGVNVTSAVSDGGKAILKALNAVYPDSVSKDALCIFKEWRWSAHTKPKTTAGKNVASIMRCVIRLRQRRCWDMKKLFFFGIMNTENFWMKNPDHMKRSVVHAQYLRKTRRMITGALPDMFHYLDVPGLPRIQTKLIGEYFQIWKILPNTQRNTEAQKRQIFSLVFVSEEFEKTLKKVTQIPTLICY